MNFPWQILTSSRFRGEITPKTKLELMKLTPQWKPSNHDRSLILYFRVRPFHHHRGNLTVVKRSLSTVATYTWRFPARKEFMIDPHFHHLLFMIFHMEQSKFHFENLLKILLIQGFVLKNDVVNFSNRLRFISGGSRTLKRPLPNFNHMLFL